jgi:hypothetical protein
MNKNLQKEEEEFRQWFDASEREIAALRSCVFAQMRELTELLLQLRAILTNDESLTSRE